MLRPQHRSIRLPLTFMENAIDHSTGARWAGIGLGRRQFVGIVCLFWLYATLSDVLYAYGLGAGIAKMTSAPLFAPWYIRVAQHLLMLPALLVSLWAALRIEWRPLWLAVPLQTAIAAAFAAIGYPAMLAAYFVMGGPHLGGQMHAHDESMWLDPSVLSLWLASFVDFFLAYGFGLTLTAGFAMYRRFRDRELQLATLEREWSAARLAALRMQLSPHTLFNLLHTIRGQIGWDPKAAQAMIVQLADLLRRLLSAGERNNARLADELQFVRLYLDLQQQRFADRLRVSVPEPGDLGSLWVPSLILQPLIENAVVHGLAGHQDPVQIRLTAAIDGERLKLQVINTVASGAPTVGGTGSAAGIGIENVRERLQVQYGDRAALVTRREEAQWIAEITMPIVREMPVVRGERPPFSAVAP